MPNMTRVEAVRLQQEASNTHLQNWPYCGTCVAPVKEYGISDETREYVEIYARCHGNAQSQRITKPREDVNSLPGGASGWLSRAVRMLVFFPKW